MSRMIIALWGNFVDFFEDDSYRNVLCEADTLNSPQSTIRSGSVSSVAAAVDLR